MTLVKRKFFENSRRMLLNDVFSNKNIFIFDQIYYILIEKVFFSINNSLIKEWYIKRKRYC